MNPRPDGGIPSAMSQEAFADRMRELFEKTVSEAIAKLGVSLVLRNAPEAAFQAHAILNSAVMVGARDLADLARTVESKATAGVIEGIEADYRRLLALNLAEIKITVPSATYSGTRRRILAKDDDGTK